MQNMKRTVTGTLASLKPRPKTIVEDSTLGEAPHSATAPASPPSVYAPPTSFPQAMAAPKRRNTPSPGTRASVLRGPLWARPRPRQALSPTIHDRGTILVEAGRIEDEESRRLSEMAFLDY
ncbi:uncharacterized protein B0H18DRAFT_108111 [Fomitopsis serialis]|uniref:uncharacterized protein n=1 Tax=Fomitopsis serialis TaxID=139415 RepID=UPI002007E2EF|nr:uncharacterized protein B0H18DRAFT_108111 [Neoantrodia serialis]KAH9915108.1 hypothetical protein B0H18DRAFT_108111 [Neoantrodia serialis]